MLHMLSTRWMPDDGAGRQPASRWGGTGEQPELSQRFQTAGNYEILQIAAFGRVKEANRQSGGSHGIGGGEFEPVLEMRWDESQLVRCFRIGVSCESPSCFAPLPDSVVQPLLFFHDLHTSIHDSTSLFFSVKHTLHRFLLTTDFFIPRPFLKFPRQLSRP
ncbi:hypothetical protein SISSUDRAFT_512475 [Sistotremastrum suecicum HHB10207 ss-3]|uniref:Uncharacterized protein n=1 Tax=Sistotremastrum suecicum HHB10207 ss-3 TaxID=1314776 RepID=A0A166INV4_9AGAM|nr:hypothetical protein SISSUDRAFT_512475 [Sistotremastrum suecicum HHB10207 ss-3]